MAAPIQRRSGTQEATEATDLVDAHAPVAHISERDLGAVHAEVLGGDGVDDVVEGLLADAVVERVPAPPACAPERAERRSASGIGNRLSVRAAALLLARL